MRLQQAQKKTEVGGIKTNIAEGDDVEDDEDMIWEETEMVEDENDAELVDNMELDFLEGMIGDELEDNVEYF